MQWQWAHSGCAVVLLFAVTVPGTVQAQSRAAASNLNAEAIRLYRAGKYTEAIPIAQRALALREKELKRGHRLVCMSLSNLALLYQV